MLWVGASFLQGTDREILERVKGSLYSKQKGTDREISSADMLWVTRNGWWNMFCWIHLLLVKGSLYWGNLREEGRRKYLFITRNGMRNLFDTLLERNGSGNLFFRIFFLVHRSAPLRVTIEMGIALEHMKIAYMFLPPIDLDGCKRPLYYTERIGKSVE